MYTHTTLTHAHTHAHTHPYVINTVSTVSIYIVLRNKLFILLNVSRKGRHIKTIV